MGKVYDADLQYLTVALAKRVGLAADGIVHSFDDLIVGLADADLRPLLVYSLVMPRFRIYWRMLVDPEQPVPLSEFLRAAWAPEVALGMPKRLEVKGVLLESDRGFAAWVRSQGVEVNPASPSTSVDAFAKASRDVLSTLHWQTGHGEGRGLPKDLAACNDSLQEYDRWVGAHGHRDSVERVAHHEWRATAQHRFCLLGPLAEDCDLAALQFTEPVRPRRELAVDPDSEEIPLGVEGIAHLVAMWPGGPRAFFNGLSVSKRDFDFWASGRSHLAPVELAEVLHRAIALYRDEYGEWELGGGYLLVATTERQVSALYDVLSHGGDLEWAFELRGPAGELPPMRFAVFAPCGGVAKIILFERGGKAEKLLDAKRGLINFRGPVRSTDQVWATVLHLIANKDNFENPSVVGRDFDELHGEWLAECSPSTFM